MKKSVLSQAPKNRHEFDALTQAKARKLWLARQAENPKKTKDCLKDKVTGGKCCLGNGCEVLIPFTRTSRRGGIYFDGADEILPRLVAGKLGITDSASLNEKGERIVRRWVKENNIKVQGEADLTSLPLVNDKTNANHVKIGQLIKRLFKGKGFS